MEIGSIYFLNTLEAKPCSPLQVAGEHAAYFSLCREALLNLAVRFRDSKKKVLLPSYTCQTLLDPFQQEGWEITFYNIKRNLRIDTDDLKEKHTMLRPNLCVAHPYYGADLNQEELDALKTLKDAGCTLVEDLTQCVFSTQRSEIFDFFCGSYRKWFPIPDGAFLTGTDMVQPELKENTDFVQPMADAMYLRGTFHKTGDTNVKEISRRVGNQAISKISGKIVEHRMSDFSMSLLLQADIETAKKKRFENYRFLFEHLQNNKAVEILDRKVEEVTCAPLFFPIFIKNRSEFQKRLAQHEIYAPVLWPVHTDALLINNSIKSIYDEILMLPIDQRYSIGDMQRMIDVINN